MNKQTSDKDASATTSSQSPFKNGGQPVTATGSPATTRPPIVGRRSNPCDLLKNLKSVDKKNQKKPTILEQASQDWKKCKAQENIEDELKQATKSKTGYIERQRFLERSDLRQFEKEREIREKVRARTALNRDN